MLIAMCVCIRVGRENGTAVLPAGLAQKQIPTAGGDENKIYRVEPDGAVQRRPANTEPTPPKTGFAAHAVGTSSRGWMGATLSPIRRRLFFAAEQRQKLTN